MPELELLKDWPNVTGKWACARKEVWKMARLNERLRFLKYGAGEYFRRESSLVKVLLRHLS